MARKAVVDAIRKTAEHLGNTPAVCRKSYVHSGLLEAYLAGATLPAEPPRGPAGAAQHEQRLLAFLQRSVSQRQRPASLARQARAS